jgi:LysR family transcriptional regulator (chromosome initiation inhibitor)
MSLLSDPLKAFIQICEKGTVVAAAAELGITQTGVTQRLRSLENTLGVTLFLRSRSGMKKTPQAQELYHYCQNVLRLEAQTLPQLKDAQSNIEISIVGPTSLMRARIVPGLNKFLKNHSQLSLRLEFDDFEDRVQKLKSGKADFAFLRAADVPNELEGKPMTADRFVLVGPKSWKNRSLEDIIKKERIIDFDPRDDMTFRYLKKFHLYKNTRSDRHYVNNIESLIELIEGGHGYGVLEEQFLELFSKKIILLHEGHALENKMALCWMPRPIYSDLFQKMIKAISAF